MSTNTTQPRPRRERSDAKPSPARSGIETTEQSSTPEAVRAARIASRSDAERRAPARPGAGGQGRGVQWVRPTDLLARQSAALAGRGVDFEVELSRRTRSLPGQVVRTGARRIDDLRTAVTERSRRLPDVSEFGRSSQHFSWISRSGIGLG